MPRKAKLQASIALSLYPNRNIRGAARDYRLGFCKEAEAENLEGVCGLVAGVVEDRRGSKFPFW